MSDILFEIKRLQKLAGIIFESEQPNKKFKTNVSYTGIVLTEASHNQLVDFLKKNNKIPEGWNIVAHHATVNLGPYKGDSALLNTEQQLIVNSFVKNDRICAVGVIMPTNIDSKKANPHITIALNPKTEVKVTAKESNDLPWENLEKIQPFTLNGKLIEVGFGDNSFAINLFDNQTIENI